MEYKKEDLVEFNIYELRCIAQKIGVRAPTNKRKDVLIDDILDIQNNLVEPYYSNRGRPIVQGKITIEINQEEKLKLERKRVEEITKKIESHIKAIQNLLNELKL